MTEIREEQQEECQEIRQVIVAAFGGDTEANLVELLRDRNKAPVALIAVSDNKIVGHVMFSPVTITLAPKAFRAVGLAPLSVLPEFQRQGIGSILVREGLKKCAAAGFEMAVVLGSPYYYPRFGFSRASLYGLGNEYDTDEHFMAIELKDGALDKVSGIVRYSSEFKECGC
ncbi:GNAT family N-acetyltransferase [Candidatus Poribacteria bacterium]|nr:MAG: GNAT family N-acetyltransferase [Candidatus Poribacteria bacterium]